MASEQTVWAGAEGAACTKVCVFSQRLSQKVKGERPCFVLDTVPKGVDHLASKPWSGMSMARWPRAVAPPSRGRAPARQRRFAR